jgi:hypothetical protein
MSEAVHDHGVKKKVSEKVKIIQEVENNPTVSQNEIAKCFVLRLSSLSNVILRKASILEEVSWCGEHSEKQKTFISLNEHSSVPYYRL